MAGNRVKQCKRSVDMAGEAMQRSPRPELLFAQFFLDIYGCILYNISQALQNLKKG